MTAFRLHSLALPSFDSWLFPEKKKTLQIKNTFIGLEIKTFS